MRTALILTLAVAAFVTGYKLLYPSYAFRYRMTVSVEDGSQVYSGSSVIEATIHLQPTGFTKGARYSTEVRGEAIYVQLGNGRVVLALLASGKYATNTTYPILIIPDAFTLNFEDYRELPRLTGARELPLLAMPRFVSFEDPNDPKSARMFDADEFPKVFGPQVKPPNVTVEMTRDPVTCGLTEKLRWLIEFKNSLVGIPKLDPSKPERSLTRAAFTNGCA